MSKIIKESIQHRTAQMEDELFEAVHLELQWQLSTRISEGFNDLVIQYASKPPANPQQKAQHTSLVNHAKKLGWKRAQAVMFANGTTHGINHKYSNNSYAVTRQLNKVTNTMNKNRKWFQFFGKAVNKSPQRARVLIIAAIVTAVILGYVGRNFIMFVLRKAGSVLKDVRKRITGV